MEDTALTGGLKCLADGVLKKAQKVPDQVVYHQKKDGKWVVRALRFGSTGILNIKSLLFFVVCFLHFCLFF